MAEILFESLSVAATLQTPTLTYAIDIQAPLLAVTATLRPAWVTAAQPGLVQTLNVVGGRIMHGTARKALTKDLSDGCVTEPILADEAVTEDKLHPDVVAQLGGGAWNIVGSAPASPSSSGSAGDAYVDLVGFKCYYCYATNSWFYFTITTSWGA